MVDIMFTIEKCKKRTLRTVILIAIVVVSLVTPTYYLIGSGGKLSLLMMTFILPYVPYVLLSLSIYVGLRNDNTSNVPLILEILTLIILIVEESLSYFYPLQSYLGSSDSW